MFTFLDLEGGERNLNFPHGRKPLLLLGLEREEEREWAGVRGYCEDGRKWKFL